MRLILAAVLALAFIALTPTIGFQTVYAQTAPVTTTVPDTSGDDTTVINAAAGEPTVVETGDNTTVVVPVGDLADRILAWVQTALGAIIALIVGWVFRFLPAGIVQLLRTMQVEQLLARAADYGINITREAVKGKALSVNVGNEVLAKAVQYAIDNAPVWLVGWMGGPDGIRDKLIARIPMDATVSAASLNK